MDKQEAEAKAKALLEQESGWNYSYTRLRELRYSGYAGNYMYEKRDAKTLTTAADVNTMIKLAQYDRVLGATIPEMILDCCRYTPKKELIKYLISLDTTSGDEATVMKNVLEYTNEDGYNCIMACFELATWYRIETDEYPEPTTGMMTEVEDSIQMLIQLGETNNVDMKRVLNQVGKNGSTLFTLASVYSEKVASQLLDRRVNVNTVDALFQTPVFRVSN